MKKLLIHFSLFFFIVVSISTIMNCKKSIKSSIIVQDTIFTQDFSHYFELKNLSQRKQIQDERSETLALLNEKLSNDSVNFTPRSFVNLLNKKNQIWAEKIKRLDKDKKYIDRIKGRIFIQSIIPEPKPPNPCDEEPFSKKCQLYLLAQAQSISFPNDHLDYKLLIINSSDGSIKGESGPLLIDKSIGAKVGTINLQKSPPHANVKVHLLIKEKGTLLHRLEIE